MALHIHRSERADPLVDALAAVLARPCADPFAREVVAVPSRGVERWLAQQLSHVLGASNGDGVCANVGFPSSNRILDDAAAAVDDDYAAAVERWSAERAVWPLMTIVDSAADHWAAVLAGHLGAGGVDRGRRYTVASKLARHFALYARARPAMLRGWSAGRDEQREGEPLPDDLAWQARLWRELRAELGPSPAELIDAACARLVDESGRVELPAEFSIFGTTRVSSSRVAILHALAERRDVHLWLHHPSSALWDHVRDGAVRAGSRRGDRGRELIRNPLLASLSRDIRELQQVLQDVPGTDTYHPTAPRSPSLLTHIQRGLAEDTTPATPEPIEPGDRTLSVHACHGPSRQVEVVREVVLGLLADDPTLEPRDIVIMCPDVEAFAPLVAASFGMADEPGGHPAAGLRVRLADRSLTQVNPLLGLLEHLLDLAAKRITATEMLDLAGLPPVRARFGFGDEDVETLRRWTVESNARWGLDAAHREPYGLGGIAQGTWRAAVDRLLLGVAMEEDERWIGPVLPLDDVDSGAIDLAGRFAEFVDRTDAAIRAMQHTHTVAGWTALLAGAVLELGAPTRAWQEAQTHSELERIADAAGRSDVELGRADIAALIAERLSGRPTRASFRTGTLTVCTLVPMRSVPHRVVCLLGMDDGSFPRAGVVDGDDVLARDPAVGERDVRSEDRQLFLDAIGAAQEHLVIAYTGADPRTGVRVPPCVPLGELLDAVDAAATAPDGGPARDHVVVRHPLQAFDPRNFTSGALGLASSFSFDPIGLAGAVAASGERHPGAPLVGAALPPLDGDPEDPEDSVHSVDLDDLVDFVVAPMRHFLKRRLQIATWQDDSEPADALPLAMRGLPEWGIGSRVLAQRLAGTDVETCLAIAERRGDLPPGRIGRELMNRIGGTVEALLSMCERERHEEPHTVEVDLALGAVRLSGTVTGVRDRTLLEITYSTLGPRQRLTSWVRYLALVAQLDDRDLVAATVGKAGGGAAQRQVVRQLDPAEARGLLADLVALRRAGLRAPLPIAAKTSERYAERILAGGSADVAARAAASRWANFDWPGENRETAHELVLGTDSPFAALEQWDPHDDEHLRFAPLAVRLWQPLKGAQAA